MENRVNYAFVGAFVIGLLIALIFIGVWLSSSWNGKVYNTYAAYMTESVSGLAKDSTVKYNGVNIGHIYSITLDPENPQRVRLLMKIENTAPVTETTTARLITQGLTGVSFVELSSGKPNSPPLVVHPGELYPVIKTSPSLFSRLDTTINELAIRLNKAMDTFDKTFDSNTRESLQHTIANLDKVTTTFAQNTKTFDATMKHANEFFQNGQIAAGKLSTSLNSFSGETLLKVNHLLENLNGVSTQLSDISDEISQNPSILLKGRVPPKKGPGE